MVPNIPQCSGIYRITCTSTRMFYIGSARNLHRRHQNHFGELRRKTHHNQKLQLAFNKYGIDAFIFEVIELVAPILLIEREQYWLDQLKPFGKTGFNIDRVAGATRLGYTFSQESREKMRRSHLGQISPNRGKKASDETRAKQSAAKEGKPGPRSGKRHSLESRAKISVARRGKSYPHAGVPRTAETRAKISAANLGKQFTTETRQKISLSQHGNTNGAKEYVVTSPLGIEYTVRHLKGFCQEHHLTPQALSLVASGKRNHHKGWTARYLETS